MSKNLTRKGLALGAVVALSSTLIAGSPAFAVDPVLTVAPAAGTAYSTIAGEQFALKVYSNEPVASPTIWYLSWAMLPATWPGAKLAVRAKSAVVKVV